MKIAEKMKMKKVLMTLVLLPLMALADTWTDESTGYIWYYNVSGGEAEICNGYSCAVSPSPSGALEIPSQINGHPVVGIGYGAFEHCFGLESVTIPPSVTHIGQYADLELVELAKELDLREDLPVGGDLILKFGADGAVTGVLTVGKDAFTCTTTLVPVCDEGGNLIGYRAYLYFVPNSKKTFKGEVRMVEIELF